MAALFSQGVCLFIAWNITVARNPLKYNFPAQFSRFNFSFVFSILLESILPRDLNTSYRHADFLVDSQSAIHFLCSIGNTDSRRIEKTKLKLNLLNCAGWKIVFQWIPSHCDISGNEKADSLAAIFHSLLLI